MADPNLAAIRNSIEEHTAHWISENMESTSRAVITIPVVVHVVYNTSSENISDAQVISQITALNEDYSGQNSDVGDVPGVWTNLVADSEIQFALAERTPNGFETDGITRTQTDVTDWNGSDNVKYTSLGGHDAWPNTMYLNIWVCNIGGGLLGFAYPPGFNPELDGVVVGYRFFGTEGPNLHNTYDLGRTATHEVGHYLNLDHPWGPGGTNTNCNASDQVADTPVQEEWNYSCETFPHVSCSNGPNGDMFMNYMDYSDDDCLVFFTNGQKARMLAILNGIRSALKTSNGLTPPMVGIQESVLGGALLVYPNPSDAVLNIQLDRMQNAISDIRILDVSGRKVKVENGILLGPSAHRMDVSQLSKGIYILEVESNNERVTRRINIIE